MSKLTILFAPSSGSGSLKTSRSVADELGKRGHRIVFALDEKFKGQLEKYGYEEVLHSVPELKKPSNAELWTQFVWKNSDAMKGNPMEIIDGFVVKKFEKELIQNKALDKHYRSIIAVIRPDLIIVDGFVCSPALTNSGIPWIYLYSGAPLFLLNDMTLPPPFSEIQMKSGNIVKWNDFRKKLMDKISNIWNETNRWCESVGAPQLEQNRLHPISPFLNIYILPKELNYYSDQRINLKNWMRVDCLTTEDDATDQEFRLHDHMVNKKKKIVLVNMGSLGTSDVELMRKLVTNLNRSDYMFIIITGAQHGQYELANNMMGLPSVSMAKALPKVDLVILSGSNYDVCEALYFGKPMIVLPLYGDQFENAQRIREMNCGLTLCPYTCSVTSLVGAIDSLLADRHIMQRAQAISHRLNKSNDKKRAIDFIEELVLK